MLNQEKASTLLRWREGEPQPPHTLNLRPTNNCNLRCLFCINGQEKRRETFDFSNELSDEQLFRIVREAGKMGIKAITIDGGGEPFTRKKVTMKVMETAKKFEMRGLLVTNGTLLTQNIIERIVKIDWDRIHFSVDGPDAKTHDHLRGIKGAFKKTISNIKHLQKYKRKYQSEKPEIIIAMVITNKNYDMIFKMINLVHELGASSLFLQPMYIQTKKAIKLKLSRAQKEEWNSNLDEIKKFANKLNVGTNIHEFYDHEIIDKSDKLGSVLIKDSERYADKFISSHCFAPFLYLGIRANGDCVPCPTVPSNFELDNIKEKNLKDVWFGEFFTEFREKILRGHFFKFCEKCCGNMVLETRDLRKKMVNNLNLSS